MAAVQVRYIVNDVDDAIAFYCRFLGLKDVMHPVPAFAMLSRRDLRLVLGAPNPTGRGQAKDIEAIVEKLRKSGVRLTKGQSPWRVL